MTLLMTEMRTAVAKSLAGQRSKERGCGFRKVHALYLESLGIPGGNLPKIVTLEPALPIDLDQSRGFVYVGGDEILALRPVSDSLRGSSLENLWHKEGLERLGMALNLRKRAGLGRGRSVDETARLLSRLRAPARIASSSKWWDFSTARIAAVAKESGDRAHISDARRLRKARGTGQGALAACWRLAFGHKAGTLPAERADALRDDLVKVVVGLGAGDDARVMAKWLAQ